MRSKNGGTHNSSLPLNSLSRSKTGNRESQLLEGSAYAAYSYGVAVGSRETPKRYGARDADLNAADATSVDSDDSQKMIIRKEVAWEVQHESDGNEDTMSTAIAYRPTE